MQIDKRQVLAALRARVAEQLDALTAAQHAAQSGATHEESRAEHDKDTRAIEAQYLARGLAARVENLWDAAALLSALGLVDYGPDDPIGATALVGVEDEAGEPSVCFLVPAAGGETVTVAGTLIQAITGRSPLGEALVGRVVGEDVDVPPRRAHFAVTREEMRRFWARPSGVAFSAIGYRSP